MLECTMPPISGSSLIAASASVVSWCQTGSHSVSFACDLTMAKLLCFGANISHQRQWQNANPQLLTFRMIRRAALPRHFCARKHTRPEPARDLGHFDVEKCSYPICHLFRAIIAPLRHPE